MSALADSRTIEAYRTHAIELTAYRDKYDRTPIIRRALEIFPAQGRILEVGCGAGIEAHGLSEAGFDVIATDGVEEMLAEAKRRYPQLSDRFQIAQLPRPLPFASGSFDGVAALAVLLHLPCPAVEETLREFHRVLRPGGRVFIRVIDFRPNLDSESRDDKSRLFTFLPPEIFIPLAESAKFKVIESLVVPDLYQRSNVIPREYVLEAV